MSAVDKARLRELAEGVTHWGSSFTHAWPSDPDFNDSWTVGSVDEDGNQYPIIEVDADFYDAAGDSEKLARFFTAANPATVLALLDECENYRFAFNEWHEKTEWIQKTATPAELGKHRADVMADRINKAREMNDQLREIAMRLVDLQNSGRSAKDSFGLWNEVADQARQVLGLEVRNG